MVGADDISDEQKARICKKLGEADKVSVRLLVWISVKADSAGYLKTMIFFTFGMLIRNNIGRPILCKDLCFVLVVCSVLLMVVTSTCSCSMLLAAQCELFVTCKKTSLRRIISEL